MFRRVVKGCVENALHTEAPAINVNACSQNMFVVQYGTGIKEKGEKKRRRIVWIFALCRKCCDF